MIVWGWFLRMWIIPLPIHWVFDHRQNSGLEVPTKKYLFNSGITQLYLQKINCCQGSTHPQAPPFFFGKPAGCTRRHPSDPTIPGPSLSRSCAHRWRIQSGSEGLPYCHPKWSWFVMQNAPKYPKKSGFERWAWLVPISGFKKQTHWVPESCCWTVCGWYSL